MKKYKVLMLFTDSVGGKDGKGKNVVYDPNGDGKKRFPFFPVDGVDVDAARIKALSTASNKLGYPVIAAELTPEERDEAAAAEVKAAAEQAEAEAKAKAEAEVKAAAAKGNEKPEK